MSAGGPHGNTRRAGNTDDRVQIDLIILELDFDASLFVIGDCRKNAGRGTKRVFDTRFVLTLKSRREQLRDRQLHAPRERREARLPARPRESRVDCAACAFCAAASAERAERPAL